MSKKQNNDKMKQYQIFVEQYINKEKTEDIDYDENFESISKKNISYRDDSYTDLLQHFVNITKKRNTIKEVHKWIYFWIIMILTASFVIFIFILLSKIDFSNNNTTNNLIMVISSIVSFCSVIISIPLIITKYLFSSKEDKRIARIILHTQQHDIDGKRIIEGIKNIDKKLDKIEGNNEQNDIIKLLTETVQMSDSTLNNQNTDMAEQNV